MTEKRPSSTPETRGERVRLNRAVRRATGLRANVPSLRAMLRACAVYANVIALAVALGVPGSGLRSAASSAISAFESAVRTTSDSVFVGPDMLAAPVDLSEVTEPASDPQPAAVPVVAELKAPAAVAAPVAVPVFGPPAPQEVMSVDRPWRDTDHADSEP